MCSFFFFFWKRERLFLFFLSLFFLNPRLRVCLLILERVEGRERKISEREKHQSVASSTFPTRYLVHMHPDQVPNVPPKHVPWPGIKLSTFWFRGRGQCSNQLSHNSCLTIHPKLSYIKIYQFKNSWYSILY